MRCEYWLCRYLQANHKNDPVNDQITAVTSLFGLRLPAETVPVPDTTCSTAAVGPHNLTHLVIVGQRIFNTKCRLKLLTMTDATDPITSK